ncbi:MAG: 39S ribosomal protein L51, mitochondrial [Piccolia ochrophora]|nr:MAG: 39S ribosomal protein L51, mitochondrial [Piccolia ochrophora]
MPVAALRAVAQSRNGVASFILPCKRLDFHYNDWAGSSKGMNAFLAQDLPSFATLHPSIEITVSPRHGPTHPVIRASYVNGREKVVCVRNLTRAGVREKAELLREASGEKVKKGKLGTVEVGRGRKEGVRGIWSALHAFKTGGEGRREEEKAE